MKRLMRKISVGNVKDGTVNNYNDSIKVDDRTEKPVVLEVGLHINHGFTLSFEEDINSTTSSRSNSRPGTPLGRTNAYNAPKKRRHSSYEGYKSLQQNEPLDTVVVASSFDLESNLLKSSENMVDQEEIIALTRHVRSFSDALNNLRNTFKESFNDDTYDEAKCKSIAHSRLGEVLKILKQILAKYPPLHSPDILTAASNIIKKIKSHDYAEGKNGPSEYYADIDKLALSFSSSVHEFLLGDKEMMSPSSPGITLDQEDDGAGYPDDDFFQRDEDEKPESEDSRERHLYENHRKPVDLNDPLASPTMVKMTSKVSSIQRTDELDRSLLNIAGSVEITLQRTKVWAKYAKDILTYFERRSAYEMECSRQIAKIAQSTRTGIMEESYLPFQSIFATALENDCHFANNYNKSSQTTLQSIVDRLTTRQKDHDSKRTKIKARWKNEVKKLNDSRDRLREAKKTYIQKQKDLEKFNKQQLEGKDEKSGFSIGKKKGHEDFQKSAEESEQHYKQCVDDTNYRQQELERIKSESLIELRELVYQCDMTMKEITIDYFKMMNTLYCQLPVQYRTLAESCKNYEEGQQFAEFVKLQSTINQAMVPPTYAFEPYRGESSDKYQSSIKQEALSNDDYLSVTPVAHPRRGSINSEQNDRQPKQAWGSSQRNKGSATDDTDSLSSRSPTTSPQISPTSTRKKQELDLYSDDEIPYREPVKGPKAHPPKSNKLSQAAKSHKFRRLRTAARCKECESYVYFNGNECEKCGLICHKKCLEKLAIKCGNKRLPRKMTTFGVDFHQHLAATKRKDIPYIMEKCIDTIDEKGVTVKGIYRVSGVKSKVEKLCQQFETGGDLVDLSITPPHFIASALKLYLRQLPEPLLTFKLYQSFINIAKDSMALNLKTQKDIDDMTDTDANSYEDIIKRIHQTVKTLPSANFFTTAKLMKHLKRVADHAEENQMSAANIAIVFGPTLLRPEESTVTAVSSFSVVMDMPHQNRAVELLILNSHIFSVGEEGQSIEGSKTSSHVKKRIETVPESPVENKSDLSVGQEFSKEVFYIMDKRLDEGSQAPTLTVLPGQTINDDYDNLRDDFQTSNNDFPPSTDVKVSQKVSIQSSNSDATEYESALSRLSSIDSPLSDVNSSGAAGVDNGGIFGSQSPVNLPDSSEMHDEEDDDAWMNRFGKEPLKKTLSGSGIETTPISAPTFGLQSKKKMSHSRLETTTYSFSIGNAAGADITEAGTTNNEGTHENAGNTEPWVKRDSKERQPVRKHLKAVNVKSTTSNSSYDENSVVEDNSITVNLLNGENSAIEVGTSVEISTKIDSYDFTGTDPTQSTSALRSPSKQAPIVLPKPKKPLDKKSWTADLIKSKAQKIPDHAQPGSLNEKLINSNRRTEPDSGHSNWKSENDPDDETNSTIGKQQSVKEILDKFEHPDIQKQPVMEATEKYV